jgi:hypothetical protein
MLTLQIEKGGKGVCGFNNSNLLLLEKEFKSKCEKVNI